jgi:hypothetical protein
LSRALAGPLLRAKGHQNAMVLYGLVACGITLASGFVTAEQALVVVVLGWAARNLVSLPWSYVMVSRYGRIPVRDQVVSIARPLAPMAAMIAAVLLTQYLLADAPAVLRLVSAILVGLVTAVITVPLFNWRMISELRHRIGRLRRRRRVTGGCATALPSFPALYYNLRRTSDATCCISLHLINRASLSSSEGVIQDEWDGLSEEPPFCH